MNRRLLSASSLVVAMIGFNVALMTAQRPTAAPGAVADWNELSQIRGEVPTQYCDTMTGAICTNGVAPAAGNCVTNAAATACTLATRGAECNQCNGGRNQTCATPGTYACAAGTPQKCCAPNICQFAGGLCQCNGAGALGGSRTVC